MTRMEQDLSREAERSQALIAERDAASQKEQQERDKSSDLQVRLAEMERQLKLAILQSEGGSGSAAEVVDFGEGVSLDVELAHGGHRSPRHGSLLSSPPQPDHGGQSPSSPPPLSVPPQRSPKLHTMDHGPSSAEQREQVSALQEMLVAVQAAASRSSQGASAGELERWDDLTALFQAAARLRVRKLPLTRVHSWSSVGWHEQRGVLWLSTVYERSSPMIMASASCSGTSSVARTPSTTTSYALYYVLISVLCV
jgi:hypothetical protein